MNRLHHLIQLPVEFLTVARLLLGGLEHGVDCGVELPARADYVLGLVKALTRLETPFGPLHGGEGLSAARRKLRVGQEKGRQVGFQI